MERPKPRELTVRPLWIQHARGTGPVRTRRPLYVDLLPPCNNACPAGENIQGWLDHARAGAYEKAWRVLMEDNPMPSVHGRVCYHPCENACNRNPVDNAVNIHAVERFLGDLASREGWQVEPVAPPSGRRVLVVGAGPSGLSAAYHLCRLGHTVEIREAGPLPGGMMHFGIPAYRMPRDELEREVARIEAMGVTITLNHKVEDVLAEKAEGGFDAVFLAIGAQLGKRVDIPVWDAGRMLDAVSFLRDAATGQAPALGRRVAVYGAGNTAMDVARTARRLGAEEALIVFRRGPEQMTAHPFEAEQAMEEGVKLNWLRAITAFEEGKLQVEVIKLDEQGYPQPTGQVETLEADSLILALGQRTDATFLQGVPGVEFTADGTVVVGEDLMTGHPGLFAGGDMVPGDRTVTSAVGHGKKAARHIDAFLHGTRYEKPPKHPLIGFEGLHIGFLTDAEQRRQGIVDPAQRRFGFEEIAQGLSEAEAAYEAKRCFSCGNCFECDGCYGACPEDAIVKLGPGKRYRFDFTRCTGCAVCFDYCPCHAIEMIPEPGVDHGTGTDQGHHA